jgi:hypothetical protein
VVPAPERLATLEGWIQRHVSADHRELDPFVVTRPPQKIGPYFLTINRRLSTRYRTRNMLLQARPARTG